MRPKEEKQRKPAKTGGTEKKRDSYGAEHGGRRREGSTAAAAASRFASSLKSGTHPSQITARAAGEDQTSCIVLFIFHAAVARKRREGGARGSRAEAGGTEATKKEKNKQ